MWHPSFSPRCTCLAYPVDTGIAFYGERRGKPRKRIIYIGGGWRVEVTTCGPPVHLPRVSVATTRLIGTSLSSCSPLDGVSVLFIVSIHRLQPLVGRGHGSGIGIGLPRGRLHVLAKGIVTRVRELRHSGTKFFQALVLRLSCERLFVERLFARALSRGGSGVGLHATSAGRKNKHATQRTKNRGKISGPSGPARGSFHDARTHLHLKSGAVDQTLAFGQPGQHPVSGVEEHVGRRLWRR